MKTLLFILSLGLAGSAASFAHVTPPQETLSRALQQARRVASMENDNDLPSRAVWLGQRVAKNAKLAVKETPKKKKKSSP